MQPTRFLLQLNASTCLAFGVLLAFFAPAVATVLGAMPAAPLQWIGAALMFHSGHLLRASFRKRIGDLELWYFSGGDLLWFLASLCLVAATDLVTTAAGVAATLVVAVAVAMIGLAQIWAHAETTGAGISGSEAPGHHLPAHHSRLQAIGMSWWALPRWVKLWLFALNAVFLAGIPFLHEDAARIALTAWLASGPLLAAFMIAQRGLTRILGLAHLIPWIPLVVYLELRLLGDALGPQILWSATPGLFAWVVLLLACLYVCLAFDLYDALRWLRGERWCSGSARDRAERDAARVPA
jgi:hypothetical protein